MSDLSHQIAALQQELAKTQADLAATSKGYCSAVERANEAIIERDQLKSREQSIKALIAWQANDEGLWFFATTAPEKYLQEALRQLHMEIDGRSTSAPQLSADERTAP